MLSSCSAPSRCRSRPDEPVPIAVLADACGWRHRLREAPVDLAGYAASGLPARTMGRGLDEDPLFFAAALAAGARLARQGMSPGAAENLPAWPARLQRRSRPPSRPATEPRFEGLVLDFLSYLELERGLSRNTLNAYRTDLLQYGEFLAAHEIDALTVRPADDRRLPRRAGDRQRPARPARRRRSTARPPACAPSTSTCAATS